MIKSAASKGLQDSTTILVNVITEEVEPPIAAASPPPTTNSDLPVKIESSPTREVKKKQKQSKKISANEPSSSEKNFLDSKVPKSFLNSIKLKDPIFISITSILTLVIVFSSYWMASTAFGLITRTQSSIKRSETILSERLITKTSLSLNWNDKQSIGPLCVTLWKQGMNNWVKELSEKTNGEAYTKSLSAFLNYHFSVPNGRFEQGVELEKSISHGLSLGDLSNYIYNTTFLLDLSSKQSSPKKAEATYEDHSHLNLYHKLVKTHRRAAESRVKLVKAASVVDDVERKIIWSEYVNWIGDGLKRCATDQENQLNAAEQGGSFKFFVAGTSCSELKELYATLTAEEKIE